jgi:nitrogen fixation/metabolism regulation signal transduction histidine kinase
MVPAALRRLGTLGLIALWVLVSGGLLLLLALSVQNSVQYSKLQPWILLVNAIAVVTVSVLLARKIIELVRAFRAQVPGSRLTARTVAIFGSLVIAPLIIVYLFSLEFLNRGIDSWFKVEIKQGLTDALELSKAAMDVRMREYARTTELFAGELATTPVRELGPRHRHAAHRERRASRSWCMARSAACSPPAVRRHLHQRAAYATPR